MESVIPRCLETTFGYRPGLSAADDGFDPLLEIRRLRQDLMLRLQRLQQSIAAEEKQRAVTPPSSCRDVQSVLEPANALRPSGSETVIYVAPISRRLGDSPTDPPLSELTVITQPAPNPSEFEKPAVKTSSNPDAATTADATAFSEETPEPLFTRILAWINAVLIAIGIVGTAAGIYYHVLRKAPTSPQQLAMTLLVTGVAMVVIGVVGWQLHRQAKRQVPVGTAGPGSY